MKCVFCEIASGAIPADVVLENEDVVAFLDHKPLFPGHVLLIPRQHVETLADLPVSQLGPLFGAAQRLERAIEDATASAGSFVAINNRVSQSVPHLHIHLVPRRPKDGLKGFFWPRNPYASEADRAEMAERIRDTLTRLEL